MKQTRSSETAEAMALSRAIESMNIEEIRVCYDFYAKHFLRLFYSAMISNRLLRRYAEWEIERQFPGHHYYVVARTRYIDDCLMKQVDSSTTQLVIMGAGFDSRAYRFANELAGKKVFEIDHPATQKRKKDKMMAIIGALPQNVIYVPIDFCRQKVDEILNTSGYKENTKTFFIWEGTTPYISDQARDETLAFVYSTSGPGSSIVFDYIYESLVQGTCEIKDANRELEKMAKTSEPYVSGIDKDRIESFLHERGFVMLEHLGSEDLEKAYLKGRESHARIKPWWRIVHAAVRR